MKILIALVVGLTSLSAFAAPTPYIYVYPRCSYDPHLPKDVKTAIAKITLVSTSGEPLEQTDVPTALDWDFDTLHGTFWGAMAYVKPAQPLREVSIQCVMTLKNGAVETAETIHLVPIKGVEPVDALKRVLATKENLAFEVLVDF